MTTCKQVRKEREPRKPRKPRAKSPIEAANAAALEATGSGPSLMSFHCYLPESLVLQIQRRAVDRDSLLRMLNASVGDDGEWPADVVPIKGASGVVAQMLSDGFEAEADDDEAEAGVGEDQL